MNTRKSNAKKLRLPTAGATESRNARRKATSTISTFFTPEENTRELPNDVETVVYSQPLPSPIEEVEIKSKKTDTRTKLSTFLPMEMRMKPVAEKLISEFLTKPSSDDFDTTAKNIKKAPKTKSKPRPKRQQKIKTAFLKNEEIFSAVTAQHCLVDNINPDEMQLALALSKSEADMSGVIVVDDEENDDKAKGDHTGIRDKLKKFGFRVGESEDYNMTAFMPTKKKTKWANKFTALTLRNPKRQLEKVNQRVDGLLRTSYESCDLLHVDQTWSYSVKSEMLLALAANDHIIIRSDVGEKMDVMEYYVLSLFEPSRTKAGHLLKDVRCIAGRDRSPVKTRPFPKEDIVLDPQLQSPLLKKIRYGEVVCHSPSSSDTIEAKGHKIKEQSSFPSYGTDMKIVSTFSNHSIDATTDNSGLKECSNFLESEITSIASPFTDFENERLVNAKISGKAGTQSQRLSLNEDACHSNEPIFNDITPKQYNSTELSNRTTMSVTQTPLITSGIAMQSQLQVSSIRSTSPDIFADSDVEMETEACNKFDEYSKPRSNEFQITTYERFSSDEEKISSENKKVSNDINHNSIPAVIDLTQCGSNSNSQRSDLAVELYQEISLDDEVPSMSLSLSLREEKSDKPNEIKRTSFSFGSSASEDLHKSTSFSKLKTEDSIDLTQTSVGDDECILLSDDEVNYSIWKTKKSLHDQNAEDPFISYNVPNDHLLNGSIVQNEFSFVELVANSQLLSSQSADFDFNMKSQSNTSLDLLDLDLSKRSDFGILEEQSPFKTPTKTPKKSPRKPPKSPLTKCRRTLSESFIASTVESSAPLKRFSSTNKFSAFTNCDNDGSLSDLDDIDKLIYGSPSKKVYKKPTGLDQLLTGAISVEVESPQKRRTPSESPKEFEFNGRTYLVRTSNVAQKPNYEAMDESALLDQLFRYGIRKLNRKQAVKILEYVYNQTHPCLIDESEILSNKDHDDEIVSEDQDCTKSSSKFNLKDCWGHIIVSEIGVEMEIEDEQYTLQTNTSKKISTALLPFHIAWYNLVKSNKQLHEAILHYEPIDLQEIYLFFKGLGYRYDPKELKYFFDSRSIIFRYDLNKSDPSGGANRHVRRKRHKSTQIKLGGRAKTS